MTIVCGCQLPLWEWGRKKEKGKEEKGGVEGRREGVKEEEEGRKLRKYGRRNVVVDYPCNG